VLILALTETIVILMKLPLYLYQDLPVLYSYRVNMDSAASDFVCCCCFPFPHLRPLAVQLQDWLHWIPAQATEALGLKMFHIIKCTVKHLEVHQSHWFSVLSSQLM